MGKTEKVTWSVKWIGLENFSTVQYRYVKSHWYVRDSNQYLTSVSIEGPSFLASIERNSTTLLQMITRVVFVSAANKSYTIAEVTKTFLGLQINMFYTRN